MTAHSLSRVGINHPLRLVALWGGYDVGTNVNPCRIHALSCAWMTSLLCLVLSLRIMNHIFSPRRLLSDLRRALLQMLVCLNRLQ